MLLQTFHCQKGRFRLHRHPQMMNLLFSPASLRDPDALLKKPCFVFYKPMGFGVEFSAVRDAYEKLSILDSWLILLTDASAGIHRPEGRWDDEKLIVA